MRALKASELSAVAGGGSWECTPSDGGSSGNNYGGVREPESFGSDVINFYEGLVSATSHIIERVANAL